MRILIVEDEFNLADAISDRLKSDKYIVDICTDGEEGLYNAMLNIYDLIILDVMLPEINGFEILSKIRKNKIQSRVIMLTAKGEIEDKLEGLNGGANDYITKPFHIEELAARVNVQLKGTVPSSKNVIEYNDLCLNLMTSTLSSKNTKESVELVCKEFQLVEYFINNKEQILSKEQIYDKVWGIENEIESNNLEVYLSFIRRKLKAIGTTVTIKAVRGLGYKMEDENAKLKK